MKITNREVIQSYLLTTAKYDFSVYEKRIIYRIIENLQAELEGKQIDTSFQTKCLFGGRLIKMPIKSLLNGEEDKNHTRVKKALTDLRNKTFEVEDDESWRLVGIIEKPVVFKGAEYVEFELQDDIYNAIFAFAKGYRKFELKTAMEFESIYAMRFYELFSHTKTKQTFRIDWLKTRFGLENKYKRSSDFIEYVVKAAKKELDKKSPYSFKFEPVKEGRKITKIDFWPVVIPKNTDENLQRKSLQKETSPRWDLDTPVLDSLTHNFGFTLTEIKRNIDLLKAAQDKLDLAHFLSSKKIDSEGKGNPKGWLINALKSEILGVPQL